MNTTVILSVRTSQLIQSVYSDFSIVDTADKDGIFVASGLEKRTYLKLQQIYHPDVFNGCKSLATTISQQINAAKDGASETGESFEDFIRRYQQRNSRPTVNVEERLNLVPDYLWQYYGGRHGFTTEIDFVGSFNAFKTIDLGYAVVSVRITITEEKVTNITEYVEALTRHSLLHFFDIDWNKLLKDDLQQILTHEGLKWYKSWTKARLIDALRSHASTINIDNVADKSWSIEPHYGVIRAWDLLAARQNANYKFKICKTPEEVAREREEKQRREQQQYGRYMSATEWIRLNGLGFLGRDRFIQLVSAAEQLALDLYVIGDRSGKYPLWPAAIWDKAYRAL